MGSKLDATLAILNGVMGDHLARSQNGLATEMTWALPGRVVSATTPASAEDAPELAAGAGATRPSRALRNTRAALARAYPAATDRVVVLVHGVMTDESIWRWPDAGDYGSLLAADLGFTPLYLRYNSGRAIADNGVQLAGMLETLLAEYPVPIREILLLGYSMGGLVIRSACHAASEAVHAWLAKVKRAIYLGTPHRGAPLERAGRALAKLLTAIPDPYTRLIADVANVRSSGLKDLGDARLLHAAADGGRTLADPHHPVPLLPSIAHYLIAGSLVREPFLAELFGDALVPVSSATDGAVVTRASMLLPPEHVRLLLGLGHLELPRHPDVYALLRAFCEGERP